MVFNWYVSNFKSYNQHDVNNIQIFRVCCLNVWQVFFPIIQGRHFFVVCMNMKDGVVQLFDNLLTNEPDEERFDWFILRLVCFV